MVFLHMKTYYLHLLNGVKIKIYFSITFLFVNFFIFQVNNRYQNTFENDTDIRINIIPTNFLFLTVNIFILEFNSNNFKCWIYRCFAFPELLISLKITKNKLLFGLYLTIVEVVSLKNLLKSLFLNKINKKIFIF